MVLLQDFLNNLHKKNEEKNSTQEINAQKLLIILKNVDPSLELEGNELDLSGYKFLEQVVIDGDFLKTPLTKITLPPSSKLFTVELPNNKLTSVDFLKSLPASNNLRMLNLGYNNIENTDLQFLKSFTNLQYCYLGNYYNADIVDYFINDAVPQSKKRLEKKSYNKFSGSLEPIKDCFQLEKLCIADTDIDGGLEYLPLSLIEANERAIRKRDGLDKSHQFKDLEEYLVMLSVIDAQPLRDDAKCKVIWEELRKHGFKLREWQKANIEKLKVAQPQLFNNIFLKDIYK